MVIEKTVIYLLSPVCGLGLPFAALIETPAFSRGLGALEDSDHFALIFVIVARGWGLKKCWSKEKNERASKPG